MPVPYRQNNVHNFSVQYTNPSRFPPGLLIGIAGGQEPVRPGLYFRRRQVSARGRITTRMIVSVLTTVAGIVSRSACRGAIAVIQAATRRAVHSGSSGMPEAATMQNPPG
jgi:hypothetical protein